MVAVPFGGTALGDYGAEVIKIEPPNPPTPFGSGQWVEERYQPCWLPAGWNELPVTRNLKRMQGQRIFAQLVAEFDILLEIIPLGSSTD